MNAQQFRTAFQRHHSFLILIVLLSSLVIVYGFASSTAQSPTKDEREIENKIPAHLPIKVKVKRPEKIKDPKNEDWFSDLEVEIKNTGSKPIYFVEIALFLPDVLAEGGRSYAYKLEYGRIALAAFEEPVRPDDVPIQPGESVTIKGHVKEVEGWKRFRVKGKVTNPKKLEFKFQEINHGDGTGFVGYDGHPIPVIKEKGSNINCGKRNKEADVAATSDSPPGYIHDIAILPINLLTPVSFMPAVFLLNIPHPSRQRVGISAVRFLGLTVSG